MKDICFCSAAFCDDKSLSLVQGRARCGKRTIGRDKSANLKSFGLADDPACRNPCITQGCPKHHTLIPKCKLEPGPPGLSEPIWIWINCIFRS